MPWEYEVRAHSANSMGRQTLQDWLSKKGAAGWRLVSFHADIDQPIIFEREVEVNQKLRDIQLGKVPEGKKTDDGSNEKTD